MAQNQTHGMLVLLRRFIMAQIWNRHTIFFLGQSLNTNEQNLFFQIWACKNEHRQRTIILTKTTAWSATRFGSLLFKVFPFLDFSLVEHAQANHEHTEHPTTQLGSVYFVDANINNLLIMGPCSPKRHCSLVLKQFLFSFCFCFCSFLHRSARWYANGTLSPMRGISLRPDNNTGNSVPYSLRIVCGFFNIPQLFTTRVVRRDVRLIVLIREDLKV